ncbi:TRAF3-interacting protein 1-like [Vespa mandarinia]|uniref:TRAF3-interacting protein 1-like n=1 Tax=Vespa mandarinia TaxID=7446 RepID=UPI0016078148|nr:TRAF3-interacting protein 1-like [Vespa mandarinia]XP_035729412.1 TRAF3-interacting protein 1-like [Vespa mandarinia]
MADDVKPEVIKKTQDLLGKYFKKPPLTEKLLRKPPFRFLHDIISIIIKETGFLEGLFTEKELNSDNIKDKESKVAYLTKLIDVVKIISGNNLTVRASKIVSGQEATKTNDLLQAIGKALDKKVNSAEAIEHYKKSLQKKSKGGTKLKTSKDDIAKKTSRQISQTRKSTEKETHASGLQKKFSSVGKVESKIKEENNQENSINKSSNIIEQEIQENNIEKSNDVNIPLAEPLEDELSSVIQKTKHSSAITKQKQDHISSVIPTEIKTSKLSTNINTDKKSDEYTQRKESTNRTKRVLSKQGSEFKESIKISETISTRKKSIETTDEGKLETEYESTYGNISDDLQQAEHDNSIIHGSNLHKHKFNSEQEQNMIKLRTLLRPPTARPSSARPAAPKMKGKTDLILNEEISTPMGNISVIIENANIKNNDNEDMVIVENKGSIETTLENISNYKVDYELTQEHGHLVAQILETQRELVNSDNVDVLPKKVDIAWEAGTKREHEAAIKEIDKLRSTIQMLTRATNPLGKLLDYLQEDIEMMQKELHDWRSQYNQLSKQLEKEQIRTQEIIDPMQMTLKEIDNNIQDQLNKIYQVKARIIKNNQKIQRLLNGDI